MFCGGSAEKCIIVQFLGVEKTQNTGKTVNAEFAECAEERFEVEQGEEPGLEKLRYRKNIKPRLTPSRVALRIQNTFKKLAKSFICTHISHGPAVSALFAYTS